MKIEKRILSTILILALFTISLTIVNAVPGIPHKFLGSVTIDGTPALAGTLVEARIGGVTYATTTTVDGCYGYDPLFYVPADDPDFIAKDGGENGDIIDFYVDGVWASNYTFQQGEVTLLNLIAFHVIEHDIDLFEGWNLISLPCKPEDPSIEVVLADILENVKSVWTYDGETETWSSYSPGVPSDLTEMVEDQGYWINMKTNEVLTILVRTRVIRVHPLNGMNIRIGMTSASTEGMENTVILAEEILEPKINDYVNGLGLDITFDFVVEDNNASESIALEKTQWFKQNGIDLIIGHGWSGQCAASLSYVNENDMLMLSGSSTSPLLTIPDDRLFRTCPTDFVQAPAIASMWDSWGIRAIIVMHRGDSWGDGLYNILEEELDNRGIDLLCQIRYGPESTEFSNYLDLADDILRWAIEEYGGAKYVGFQYISFDEARTMQTQAAYYPNLMDVIWMGTESNGRSERMITETGELCLRTRHFSALMVVDEGSHLWNEFKEIYYEKTHYMPGFYTATQYDAAWLLVETILKTASTDASVIAEALIPTSCMMHGISGWMALDEYGDRAAQIFDIWGYYEHPDVDIWFQKWGTYDGRTNEVSWDDGKIIDAGIDAPRVTD